MVALSANRGISCTHNLTVVVVIVKATIFPRQILPNSVAQFVLGLHRSVKLSQIFCVMTRAVELTR